MLEKQRIRSLPEIWIFETILYNQIITLYGSLIVKLELNIVNRKNLAMCPGIRCLMLITKVVEL